jgi:hypothetical protein
MRIIVELPAGFVASARKRYAPLKKAKRGKP